MSPTSTTSAAPDATLNTVARESRTKRRLDAVMQELKLIKNNNRKKARKMTVTEGRGIRRLVALFDSIDDHIEEADRRADLADNLESALDDDFDEETVRRQDRLYQGYTLLLSLIPSFRGMVSDADLEIDEFKAYLRKLQKGANEARSDDVRRIKEAVVKWLSTTPLSDADAQTIMSDADKLQRAALLIGIDQAHRTMSRGFNNDVTGLLLCPIDYDWSLASVRKGIKDGDPEFSLADNFYLRALYKNATSDPDDVQKGFLRSQLLVQTFQAIFTSPSSVTTSSGTHDENTAPAPLTASQKKATKANVSCLLSMDGRVTGRSIAHAAVMLVFNLTDAPQWTESYYGLSFTALYEFLVDYFEEPPANPAVERQMASLFKWWNRQIFPHRQATVGKTGGASRARLERQRASQV